MAMGFVGVQNGHPYNQFPVKNYTSDGRLLVLPTGEHCSEEKQLNNSLVS